jgi:hypothetical protein
VVYLLDGMGYRCGVNLAKLADAGRFISAALGRATSSRVGRALDCDDSPRLATGLQRGRESRV